MQVFYRVYKQRFSILLFPFSSFSSLPFHHRQDVGTHLNQCPRRPITCKFCSSTIPFDEMEKHASSCRSAQGLQLEDVDNDDEDSFDPADPAAWQSGRACGFGCSTLFFTPESYAAHTHEGLPQHCEQLRRRVKRLEVIVGGGQLGKKALVAKMAEWAAPRHQQQQQQTPPSSQMENDSEMEDMDETGPGVNASNATAATAFQECSRDIEHLQQRMASAGAGSSASGAAAASLSNARIEVEIQRISERLRTLESERQTVASDSAPSSSSSSSSPATSAAAASSSSSGFAFQPPGGVGGAAASRNNNALPAASSASPREEMNSTAMRKLELCFRKAETYEGMAMVLNVSLDRLLSQVTEMDNQRRTESEAVETQRRKISVRKVVWLFCIVGMREGGSCCCYYRGFMA